MRETPGTVVISVLIAFLIIGFSIEVLPQANNLVWAIVHPPIEIPPGIEATVDIDPDALNLKSKGKWITVYIELPDGYDVSDINVSTVALWYNNNANYTEAELKYKAIGDYDGDSIPDVMLKFNGSAVRGLLSNQVGEVELTVTGKLNSETFEGSDTVKAIRPGRDVVGAQVKVIAARWRNAPPEERARYAEKIADSLLWWYYSIVPPDLAVSSSDIETSEAIVGQNITLAVTVHNYGDVNAGNFLVQLSVDGISTVNNNLSLGADSEEVTQFIWLVERGAHDIEVRVDPENVVEELNEENNIAVLKVVGKNGEAEKKK